MSRPLALAFFGWRTAVLIGAGLLRLGGRIPDRARTPTDARTWYGSRINDTTLAELVGASEALAAASATVMAARTGTTLRHVIDRGAVIRS